ncbi:hypothetical protein ACQP2H_10485 [Micromonospora sp. CA-248260]|uniref:hypothetical protein n=1 Tax=Micromonospora sp. CA-248260 TaxID=3239962 RepID=UPI003D8EE419
MAEVTIWIEDEDGLRQSYSAADEDILVALRVTKDFLDNHIEIASADHQQYP